MNERKSRRRDLTFPIYERLILRNIYARVCKRFCQLDFARRIVSRMELPEFRSNSNIPIVSTVQTTDSGHFLADASYLTVIYDDR